jgi:hypothetical protein
VSLHRLLLGFLLLATPMPLLAQWATTTVVGRAMNRRALKLEKEPAVAALVEAGVLNFDEEGWDFARMPDTAMVLFVQLMADLIEREEKGLCLANINSQGVDLVIGLLGGVTDSLEGERWADLVEHVVMAVVAGQPIGPAASRTEIESRFIVLISNLSEKDTRIAERADEDPAAFTCMLMRVVMLDLRGDKPSVVGPMVRGLMTIGAEAEE